MEKMRYVYVIRYRVSYEDGSQSDFCGTYRVYSSLRKAIDLLELYKEIYTAELLSSGYDIERDVNHWIDYREDGHYSFLNIKNDIKLTTYRIYREILF